MLPPPSSATMQKNVKGADAANALRLRICKPRRLFCGLHCSEALVLIAASKFRLAEGFPSEISQTLNADFWNGA
jgi:hypothetical protein